MTMGPVGGNRATPWAMSSCRPWSLGWVLLGFLLFFSVEVNAAKKRLDTSFANVLQRMVDSDTSLLELDDKSFNELLIGPGASRDYAVVLMLTARDPQLGCRACQENAFALSYVASSYLGQRSPKVEEQPVIFAILDYKIGRHTFGMMEVDTVPRLFLFKAHEEVTLPPSESQQFHMNPPDPIGMALDALEERAGVIIKPVPDVQTTVIVGAVAALLLAIISYLITDQTQWVLSLPHKRSLWFFVSISVYAFGVGGMVYCIIRHAPLYNWGSKQISLFAMHTNQDQFVLEGLVVGLWNVMTGISFALAVVMASNKRNRLVQFISVNVFLALGFYFLQKVMLTYEAKTRWYNMNATLPKPVSDFLFGNIKKGTGLLRRLVRLTQLWLWNYKDWATFKSKHLHGYLVKYAEREYGHVLRKIGIKADMLGIAT